MTQQGTRGGDPLRSGGGRAAGDAGPERARSARHWLVVFVLALLTGVLMSSLVLPWKVLALVVSVFAVAAGVVALVKALGAGLPRFTVIATSIGLASALFLALAVTASVLFWPVTEHYEDCMSRALTLQARSECQDALERFATGG